MRDVLAKLTPPYSEDPLADLSGLSAGQADAVRELLAEREFFTALGDVLVTVDRAKTLEAKLRAYSAGLLSLGFAKSFISVRNAAEEETHLVSSGVPESLEKQLAASPLSAADLRTRMQQVEHLTVSESLVNPPSAQWFSQEVLDESFERGGWQVIPRRRADGSMLVVVFLAERVCSRPPSLKRIRVAEIFANHIARTVETVTLTSATVVRAERLKELHQAGAMLARTLEEGEIIAELSRQAVSMVGCDNLIIAQFDADFRHATTLLHLVRGLEQPRKTFALGDGAIARTARTGRPIRLDREEGGIPWLDVGEHACIDAEGTGSLLAAPMLAGHRLMGVIAVSARARGRYSADDEEILVTLAQQGATAVVNARLYAASQHERRQSDAMSEVAHAVNSSLQPEKVLHLALGHAIPLLRAKGACVLLLDQRGKQLDVAAAQGTAEALHGLQVPVEGSLCGKSVMSRAWLISNDVENDPAVWKPSQQAMGMRRTILAPLVTERGVIGVLAAIDRDSEFTEEDARVLQRLADHVAVAIVNARLFSEVAAATREWAVTFDAIAGGMATLDPDGRIIRWNQPATRLAAHSFPRTLRGRTLHEALLGEKSPPDDWAVDRALQTREAARGTYRAAGDSRIYEVVVSPHPDGGAVATFDDVTAHHALAERHRRVVETSNDAIVITDLERRISFANPAAYDLLGSDNGVVGSTASKFVEPADRETISRHETLALDGEPQRYETVVVRPNGDRRLVSVSTVPLRELGRITGVLASLRDVTEEHRAREAISHTEARYSRLMESAADGIFTVDRDGIITAANRALAVAIRKRRASLVGMSVLLLADERDRAALERALEATLDGARQGVEFRYFRPGGEMRHGWMTTTPVREGASVTGVLGIVRDVTDERKVTAQLVQQEKLAAIGQLVGGVAHELNNPLASVLAFSQLLLSTPGDGATDREGLETIQAEARRAARIVANLLTFARQQPPERVATDLNDVVRKSADLRRFALSAEHVELVLELDERLPRTWADPLQLQQVIMNLLTNAEQALAQCEGRRLIRVTTEHHTDSIRVSVSDSGPGVAPANTSKVFNPFFTTKEVGKGTGLGLSITHGIVREHGGRITVGRGADGGACFIVDLPLVPVPEDRAGTGDSLPDLLPQRPARVGRSVLLVDDEPSLRAVVSTFLRRAGHRVDLAASAREARTFLDADWYDVILLDVRMPEVSGDALYRELRERNPDQARRVVFFTGDLRSDSVQNFIRDSGRPSLSKPFSFDELEAALEAQAAALGD